MKQLLVHFFLFILLTSCIGGGSKGTPNQVISVDDNEAAIAEMVITNWAVPSGLYGVGDKLNITTKWIKRAVVTGTPQIALDVGGVTRYASYSSGSNTQFINWSYTIQAGDLDKNGIQLVSPINLNEGTLADVFERAATLDFSPPSSAGSRFDGVGSVFQSMTVPGDGVYGIYFNLDFTVTFDETVHVSGTPRLGIDIGGSTVYADYNGGSGSSTISFRYVTTPSDDDPDGIGVLSTLEFNGGSIVDDAGNSATLSITPPSTAGVTVDNDYPHTYSISINSGSAATNNPAVTLSISAVNAAQMYVTNVAGCGSGGSWEAYGTSKAWTLTTANAVNNVYIKWRTGSMNESGCVSDDIIYDTVAPAAGTLTLANDATTTKSNNTSWTAGSDSLSGVDHYQYAVSESTSVVHIITGGGFQDAGTNLDWEISSGITLTQGFTYYSLLKVVDVAGNETVVASDPWYIVSPPDAINNLQDSQRTKNQIDISWTAPNSNGPGITDYEIQYKEGAGPWTAIVDGVNTEVSYSHTGLTPDTEYSYRVRASNGTYWGNWSNTLTTTTLPDVPFFDNIYKAINVGGATTCQVVSMMDDNILKLNDVDLKSTDGGKFARGELKDFVCAQFDVLEGDGAFFVGGRLGAGGNTTKANIVWSTSAWVGKTFFFNHTRANPMKLHVYAFEDADVRIYSGGVLKWSNLGMVLGDSYTFTVDVYDSYEIISTGHIVAYHYGNQSGTNYQDPKPVLPVSTDIIGVPSRTGKMTSGTSSNDYTAFSSGVASQSNTLTAGVTRNYASTGTRSYYRDDALRIIADDPIVANSYADSNGNCMAPFVPTSMMKKRFALNVLSEWVAFASDQPVTINVTNPDGSPHATIPSITLSRRTTFAPNSDEDNLSPYKGYIANDLAAGVHFESTQKFQAWYEPKNDNFGANDDETIMFGWDE